MKYLLFIFYRYYNGRGRYDKVAYLMAIQCFVFPVFLYATFFLTVFDPDSHFRNEFLPWIIAICLTIAILIRIFIKEKDLPNHAFQNKYRKFHGFLAILYTILPLLLICLTLSFKKKQVTELSTDKEIIHNETVDEVIFKPLPDSASERNHPTRNN